MKTIHEHFIDWEGDVFGFGYGSGEEHIIPALKRFLQLTTDSGQYDFRVLEEEITPTVTWLLINTLCHCDMIEYGTSPRFAWLTKKGLALKNYLESNSIESIEEKFNETGNDYIHCYRNICNCDDGKCDTHNPFWS